MYMRMFYRTTANAPEKLKSYIEDEDEDENN